MKKFLLCTLLSLAALCAAAAIPSASPGADAEPEGGAQVSSGLSQKVWRLAQSAVFEVLVKKPAENPSILYDKELDWSLVPYSIRTDAYYSIGTAFAISPAQLVTAFHVIDLGQESRVFPQYFIRDSQGKVTEVAQVIRASNERDFLVFTVKDRTFDTYFTLEKNFTAGAQVFSIGNALGEGIVVRGGLVLGTVPEEEEGRWNLLKSSADGNPGNSGGPLVTPDGRVVGVVIALRDNILYSLPAAALLEVSGDTLKYRKKLTYTHLLLANRLTHIFETETNLPAAYQEVRTALTEAFDKVYPEVMRDLFDAAPAFLNGPNNMHFLNSVVNTPFPEIAFVDKNDDQWKLSNLDVKTYSLPDDGSLMQTSISDFVFMKITRPKTTPLTELNANPEVLMNLILKGIKMERTLGSSGKYRILSYGAPESVTEYTDSLNRVWIRAHWLLAYEDSCLITYILPTPSGPAVIMTKLPTADLRYEWDVEAICDHIQAAYRGDFDEWKEFLSTPKWVPRFLAGLRFEWNEKDAGLALHYPDVTIRAGSEVFDWTSKSALFLAPAYYFQEKRLEYGIRKTVIQRDIRGRDYAVLYKNVRPDARLGAKSEESWGDIVAAKYPFDEIPRLSSNDNTGFAGALLPLARSSDDIRYSLYLAMENPGSEDNIKNRLAALKDGIVVEK
ncbi:MAG: serine protease [Spirochaetales bacterium]|nr:serine protease [Spirochaetales bacterium]